MLIFYSSTHSKTVYHPFNYGSAILEETLSCCSRYSPGFRKRNRPHMIDRPLHSPYTSRECALLGTKFLQNEPFWEGSASKRDQQQRSTLISLFLISPLPISPLSHISKSLHRSYVWRFSPSPSSNPTTLTSATSLAVKKSVSSLRNRSHFTPSLKVLISLPISFHMFSTWLCRSGSTRSSTLFSHHLWSHILISRSHTFRITSWNRRRFRNRTAYAEISCATVLLSSFI